ncbi:hypothetical protein [Hydrogenophaga crocea]|uniref:Uncharacterized protein n=1 Tax=Hydrogenophaga crocea TaxID=2716225 RepID=A0A6G8IJH3_9BURK|nr:hypothetical protein [Hydrogenophaga crocea]QIM53392.1 hypothetical protein G9Q37_15120 [Hydrogenophaga crocea]
MSQTIFSRRSPSYGAYFIAIIITSSVLIHALLRAAPIPIKMFFDFPSLSEANRYEGVLEVKSRADSETVNRMKSKFFINTETGAHEVAFGYFGDRYSPLSMHKMNGAKGEVWYHPMFGVIQAKLTYVKKSGEVDTIFYDWASMKSLHVDTSISKYWQRLLMPSILTIVLVVLIRRWRSG